ncbi:hypothetical protein SUGI_0080020 [Cryptomeria japonica]|nr:hypothetical protein SUGI_0080020 [Cryptomeria japonica]
MDKFSVISNGVIAESNLFPQKIFKYDGRTKDTGSKASWLAAYKGSFPTFLQGSCISPEAAKAVTTKEILSILESHRVLLEKAVIKKQRISQDIASKDSAMRAFSRRLRDAQQVLDQTLDDYGSYEKEKEPFEEARLATACKHMLKITEKREILYNKFAELNTQWNSSL